MSARHLADKVVVVTGAGSGIGRATAIAFARAGAHVVAADVHADRLATLTPELGDRGLLLHAVDVSDRAAMGAFAEAVHARVPAIDVLVNNAGVSVGGPFLETSLDDWDWLLGINLRGVVHGCHFFAPAMVERGAGGHIVNIASILGIHAAPNVTAYGASKFAVLGFSQSLRTELAPHRIGVTAICPGMIATQIVADGRMTFGAASARDKLVATFRRGLDPAVVAAAIVDSVVTNPAVRTVGKDAWALAALTRVAPGVTRRLGKLVSDKLRRP